MGRRLVVGLVLALSLLAPAAATAAGTVGPRTVDDLVDALREDPIVVEPVLGTGDADGVHDVLTDLAAEVDVPVYVVLAPTPPDLRGAEDPAQQTAALLNDSLGDGLYYVQLTEGISWVGTFGTGDAIDIGPGQRANTRARDIGPLEYNVPTAALEAELVLRSAAGDGTEFSDDQLREWIDTPRAFVPTENHDLADRTAKRWVTTIAAALAVLVAGLAVTAVAVRSPLRETVQSSTRRGTTPPTRVDLPIDGTALDDARRRHDRLPAGDLASPFATRAEEALTAADLVATSGDDLDRIGAWVLALVADRELDRIRRPTRTAYRPCVVDPRHGEASATVRLAGSSIDAPACTACSRSTGRVLTARTWRGRRPYLDTSSVWARTGFGALVDDLARQVIDDRRRR